MSASTPQWETAWETWEEAGKYIRPSVYLPKSISGLLFYDTGCKFVPMRDEAGTSLNFEEIFHVQTSMVPFIHIFNIKGNRRTNKGRVWKQNSTENRHQRNNEVFEPQLTLTVLYEYKFP